MSKQSFKQGDLVRVTNDIGDRSASSPVLGSEGVVRKIDCDLLYVDWDQKTIGGRVLSGGGWYANRFSLVNPPVQPVARYVVVCGTDITAGYDKEVDAIDEARRASKDLGEDTQVYKLYFKLETKTVASYV